MGARRQRGRAAGAGVTAIDDPFDPGYYEPDRHYNDDEKRLANLDPAWGKAALGFRTHGAVRFGHAGRRGRSLVEVRRILDARQKRYEAGDTLELLYAVQLCAEENLPLPEWLARAFIDRFTSFTAVASVDDPTLDRAFSSPSFPTATPTKIANAKWEWETGSRLWIAVHAVKDRHNGLSTALDEVLNSRDWGIKKTVATRLVNMIDRTESELAGKQPLSRYWAKRRKQ